MRRVAAALVLVGVAATRVGAEPVTIIRNNGSPANRVDLVVLGDGYTAAELGKYAADVEAAVNGFFAQEPFLTYAPHFNVHRVDVVSAQSGADHPSRQQFVDTALDAGYDCAGIQRLICVNQTKVNNVLVASVPSPASRDIVLVIVNDPEYGGSGGPVGVASTNPATVELILHELGHSFGLLTDEYGGPPPPQCSAGEPPGPNATRETQRGQIKWSVWIAAQTPLPTAGPTTATPGLYEGAAYCDSGVYRPTWNSKMRTLGVPFEQINAEQLVKRIYNVVSGIDTSEPASTNLSVPRGAILAFNVTRLAPAGHALSVTWRVDGQVTSAAPAFNLDTGPLALGAHTVEAEVRDPTPMVRNDPGSLLTDRHTWNLSVVAGRTLSVTRAGAGTGGVTSNPAGINCGSDCAETYLPVTTVTLTAAASGGSLFGGWVGCDSVNGVTCTVTLGANRTVTATFTLPTVTLSVTVRGSASGSVSSNPAGLTCSTACAADFTGGIQVTLTATSGAGAVFRRWTGACGGTTPTCTVMMTEARAVTANFGAVFTNATVTDTLPPGTVVRAIHFTELLAALNLVRAGPPVSWSGAAPAPGQVILLSHVNTLRQALALAPVGGRSLVRAQHLDEVRAAIRALE